MRHDGKHGRGPPGILSCPCSGNTTTRRYLAGTWCHGRCPVERMPREALSRGQAHTLPRKRTDCSDPLGTRFAIERAKVGNSRPKVVRACALLDPYGVIRAYRPPKTGTPGAQAPARPSPHPAGTDRRPSYAAARHGHRAAHAAAGWRRTATTLPAAWYASSTASQAALVACTLARRRMALSRMVTGRPRSVAFQASCSASYRKARAARRLASASAICNWMRASSRRVDVANAGVRVASVRHSSKRAPGDAGGHRRLAHRQPGPKRQPKHGGRLPRGLPESRHHLRLTATAWAVKSADPSHGDRRHAMYPEMRGPPGP